MFSNAINIGHRRVGSTGIKLQLLESIPYFRAFENDSEGNGNGQGTGEPEEVQILQKVLSLENLPPELKDSLEKKVIGSVKAKKFTQDQFNHELAQDRKKHKAQINETVAQLEELKKSKQLTEQEKINLQHRIEELNATIMTAEEKAAKEKEKLEKEHKITLESTRKEADSWRSLYANETITNKILKSARENKAIRDEQLIGLLIPNTRLTEVLDDSGTPTGRFLPKVKFREVEKDGTEKELDLTIEETVKRMRELPERFGNLFEDTSSSGTGGNRANGAMNGFDPNKPPSDPAKYKVWREQRGLGRKKGSI